MAPPDEALAEDFDATAAIRPSRRRGAVVSYAEPNLRAKMRRPTKDMIDAVANQDSRRSSSFQLLQDGSDDENASDHTPRPRASGNLPADLALADQATDMSRDHSGHSWTSVSQRRRKTSSTIKADDQSLVDDEDNAGVFAPKQTTRRQPRRHSSNPKSNAGKVSTRRGADTSGEPLSPQSSLHVAHLVQSGLEDEDAESLAMEAGLRRETRVAARRRSMMV